ncbi:MAG: VWA domain-containing protein [Hyphomicrobiaceae bacterium]|nr:VWA domain-containing protein [Hyphomicrobiaceae bacterium]
MFGLIVMIIFGCSAIAIDFARVNRSRSLAMMALDSAALATAKQLRLEGGSADELKQLAQSYFESNLRAQRALDTIFDNFDVSIDRAKSRAIISVEVTTPTALGRIFDVTAFKSKHTAEAIYSARDIELAMMLDVSGSMRGTKIAALRDAAKDLVDIVLEETNGPSANRIGIAPYSTSVNAGVYAYKALNLTSLRSTCVTERTGSTAFTDASPLLVSLRQRTNTCPASPVVPLTNDKSVLTDNIEQLSDGGSTAGHLGIAWAWYLVSPEWASFWPSASAPRTYDDPEAMKAVIIMTDGEFNTAYENSNGNSVAQAQNLCGNIKKAGVTVFSVGFDAPGGALNLLKQCASKSSYFFDAKDATELRDAFTRIARELTGLRLTN